MDHIQPANIEGDPSTWWIWTCWITNDRGGGFVYGCAARAFRAADWSDERTIILDGVGRLEVRQRTLPDDTLDAFRRAADYGVLQPELLPCEGGPEVRIAHVRRILQGGLGQTAAEVVAYYTLPDIGRLFGECETAIAAVLAALEHELNLPFKSTYASRLGNFEIFQLNPWLDAPQPFLIERSRRTDWENRGPETWEISRTSSFALAPHLAHVVGRSKGDVVVDRLVTLEEGRLRVPVDTPEAFDDIDFQLFSADGRTLLHSERHAIITTIPFALSTINSQVTINDDVTERAKQENRALVAQASTVLGHTSHRSSVGAPPKGSWLEFADNMRQLAAVTYASSSEDRWFPHGINGELGAVAYLNELLHGGLTRRAVLVDPWFGRDALRRLVLRLGSQDVDLTVVTSWDGVHPDDNIELGNVESGTRQLEQFLNDLRPLLNPRLSVISVTDGSKKAFHDRYLLLYGHDGTTRVFLLSNSLNKAPGDWPFCMSLLARDVGRHVQQYIEGLCKGRDDARNKALDVNLRWPSNAV